MMNQDQGNKGYDVILKVLLLGNSNVGKSSLFLRYVDDIWNDSFVPTIGVDFKIKTFELDSKKVKMQIWDTAGQERFKNVIASYYRGANGILLVYDITDKDSFRQIKNWLVEVDRNANKNVLKVLIGNKSDLESRRAVTFEQGKEFAESNGMKFLETSAKKKVNVTQAFETITREFMNSGLDTQAPKKQNKTFAVSSGENLNEVEKKKGCC